MRGSNLRTKENAFCSLSGNERSEHRGALKQMLGSSVLWPEVRSGGPTRCTRAAILQPGDEVFIYRLPFNTRPFLEGRAVIVESAAGIPNLFKVQFVGEHEAALRFVHPGDWQSNPQQMLVALLDHFRAGLDPSVLTEFFPITPRGKRG